MSEEEEIVNELEHEVETLDHEFEEVKESDAEGELGRKQERVEEILSEVHKQLDFLKQVSKKEVDGKEE